MTSGTLVNALIAHCGDSLSGIGGVKRPGIVHRLDKDTTGLLVVAKNDRAHRSLADQFADHGRTGPLERAYLAIVWGVPDRQHGTIDAALARSHAQSRANRCGHGRERALRAHPLRGDRGLSPRGGAAGAPCCAANSRPGALTKSACIWPISAIRLLGDALYGSGFKTKANRLAEEAQAALIALGRQALHATMLGFEHPRTGDLLRFESPLPRRYGGDLLERLRDPEPFQRHGAAAGPAAWHVRRGTARFARSASACASFGQGLAEYR